MARDGRGLGWSVGVGETGEATGGADGTFGGGGRLVLGWMVGVGSVCVIIDYGDWFGRSGRGTLCGGCQGEDL